MTATKITFVFEGWDVGLRFLELWDTDRQAPIYPAVKKYS
jgi:hypothetical protein